MKEEMEVSEIVSENEVKEEIIREDRLLKGRRK